MKKPILLLLRQFFKFTYAQAPIDSLFKVIQTSKTDSIRTDAAMNIILTFGYMSPVSVSFYAEILKTVGRENNFPPAEALGYANIGFALKQLDKRASALENSLKALKIAESLSIYRVLSMVYDGLGIVYPVEDPKRLFYLFFALSRSIIVETKFIEFFGVLGLLAVFEFINLFIHPYLAHLTNDSPVLMLGVLIVIGAMLVPLHHRLEKWMTNVMIEKNKKIRLQAAEKTIAELTVKQAN